MSVTMDRRRIALHEAGHTAAWLMSGRVPASVTIDWPEPTIFGQMVRDPTVDGVNPDSAPDFALCILLGPLAEAKPGWPPEWPLDPDAKDLDTHQLAILADYLKLDEDSWYSLIRQAQHIAGSQAFKYLVGLIASMLEKVGTLSGEEIRFLVGPEVCKRYDIQPRRQSHAAHDHQDRSDDHRPWSVHRDCGGVDD